MGLVEYTARIFVIHCLLDNFTDDPPGEGRDAEVGSGGRHLVIRTQYSLIEGCK